MIAGAAVPVPRCGRGKRPAEGSSRRLVLHLYKTCPSPGTASHNMSESDNISTPHESAQPRYYKALDERLYDLNDEERSFFKDQSGIQDDEELKAHILQVQAEAYKVCSQKPLKS